MILDEILTGMGLAVDYGDLTGNDWAAFSQDRLYRYALARVWGPDSKQPLAVFVMLNPSTADAFTLDRTLMSCKRFARSWGCRGMVILNLFAYRATEPDDMLAAAKPIGEWNSHVLSAAVAFDPGPDAVWVAAWGVHGDHRGRATEVREWLSLRVQLRCLALTRDGQPGHPLYLPTATTLQVLP